MMNCKRLLFITCVVFVLIPFVAVGASEDNGEAAAGSCYSFVRVAMQNGFPAERVPAGEALEFVTSRVWQHPEIIDAAEQLASAGFTYTQHYDVHRFEDDITIAELYFHSDENVVAMIRYANPSPDNAVIQDIVLPNECTWGGPGIGIQCGGGPCPAGTCYAEHCWPGELDDACYRDCMDACVLLGGVGRLCIPACRVGCWIPPACIGYCTEC